MRKLLWGVGAIFIIVLVAIVSVPLFVDVDQYRPLITEEANKKINGKLELGKLKLSLWGAVKIHAESIKLSVNGFPEPMLDTKQFHLEVPFLSILTGSPKVIAVLDSPKISIVKDQSGMNALKLMKTAAKVEVENGAPVAATEAPAMAEDTIRVVAAAPAQPTQIPALLVGASLGLRIENGDLKFQDRLAKADYLVDGLDLEAKNLGLGSNMSLRLKAPLKGSTPSMSFEGPIEATAEILPLLAGGNVRSAKGSIELDASKLALEMKGGSFKKTSSMPLIFKAQFDGDEKEMLLKSAELRFHEVKLNGKGRFTLQPVTAKLDLNLDPMRLEKLDFVPMLAAYQLKGIFQMNANVEQDASSLRVNGDLKLSDASFFLKELFQEPLKMQMQAGFSESSLNISRAALSGPDSEIQLMGTVKNFLAPQINLSLTGKSFNLDKVMKPAEEKKKAALEFIPSAIAAEPKKKDSVNPMLELAKNPILAKASGVFSAQIGKVTVAETNLDQLNVKAQLQNLVLKLQNASFQTFGGTVKSTGEFDLKNPRLSFSTQGTVAGISAKDAFSTYFPKYKNTLEGKVDANWNLSGAAYPESARMKSMKGTAKISAVDGVLKSVDVQDSINSAIQKIPFLKDKKPIKVDDGFKSLVAELKFDGGVIKAEPIESQPRNKGFVVKGKSTIQENLEQETFFDIFDPQGQLPKELSQPGKAAIALRLYGPLNSPKTDYDYTVKKLASTAGKAAAKDAIGKFLEKQGGDGKDGGLKGLGDSLKKKFKF
jgi:uncharacterized protein involved in outer membrane biogenesis